MGHALADNYFLKALDQYPYNLPEFLESIDYALSYDEHHVEAHCLMGRFYMDQLNQFDRATYHFDMALANDNHHMNTYYWYIRLAILIQDHDKALKLITFARQLKGVCQASLLHREAVIKEQKGDLKGAKKLIDEALLITIWNNDIDFFKAEKTRIDNKLKVLKPKKKSKRKQEKKKKK